MLLFEDIPAIQPNGSGPCAEKQDEVPGSLRKRSGKDLFRFSGGERGILE
jgi:hypothetical protein